MSTKASLLLTTDNEHWYIEKQAQYYESTTTEECIVIEIDSKHEFEVDEDGLRIIVESGTSLFEILKRRGYSE